MERQLEPELMDDDAQARAYAEADFELPNSTFLNLFQQHFPEAWSNPYLLDLGCGPGDICLRFATAYPDSIVHGVDGSEPMLRFAEHALARRPYLRGRVEFINGVLPHIVLPQGNYGAVISNSLLHHLRDPDVLWQSIRRWTAPGAPVLVMDLYRPGSQAEARALVERHSGAEPPLLKRDFFNSLLAAFTPDEVRGQLEAARLPFTVDVVSDRHFAVWGRLPG